MEISRAESFVLLCQALDKVDYDKLDLNLLIVVMEAISLLQQYHAAEDLLGLNILDDDVPAAEYNGFKTSMCLLDNLQRLMESLLARAQQNQNNQEY